MFEIKFNTFHHHNNVLIGLTLDLCHLVGQIMNRQKGTKNNTPSHQLNKHSGESIRPRRIGTINKNHPPLPVHQESTLAAISCRTFFNGCINDLKEILRLYVITMSYFICYNTKLQLCRIVLPLSVISLE